MSEGFVLHPSYILVSESLRAIAETVLVGQEVAGLPCSPLLLYDRLLTKSSLQPSHKDCFLPPTSLHSSLPRNISETQLSSIKTAGTFWKLSWKTVTIPTGACLFQTNTSCQLYQLDSYTSNCLWKLHFQNAIVSKFSKKLLSLLCQMPKWNWTTQWIRLTHSFWRRSLIVNFKM